MDYRALLEAEHHNSDGDGSGIRELLRSIAAALGLAEEFPDSLLDLVAKELSQLRPLGDPRHSLRSAQVRCNSPAPHTAYIVVLFEFECFCLYNIAPGDVNACESHRLQCQPFLNPL